MHRTGKYRRLNLIFGLFPFIAAILLCLMREDSSPAQLWLSIVGGRLLFSGFLTSSIVFSCHSDSEMRLSYRPCLVRTFL